MNETLQKINEVIGKDGVKIDVGIDNTDIIYLSVGIFVALTLSIVAGMLIVKAISK